MKHVKTLNTRKLQNTVKRWMRRMSDILPVCLQDFLYSRKPDLREQISFNSKVNNDTHKRPFAQRRSFVIRL